MRPECGCHNDMAEAVRAHYSTVERQAMILFHKRSRQEWADLISDGQLALWKALANFDKQRSASINAYLDIKVRHAMLDGMRQRTHSRAAIPPKVFSLDEPTFEHPLTAPSADVPAAHREDVAEAMAMVAAIDPRLPAVVTMLAEGFTVAEISTSSGLSSSALIQLIDRIPGRPPMQRATCSGAGHAYPPDAPLDTRGFRICPSCRPLDARRHSKREPA